ncbi:MAG: hypothetical protein Q8M03_06730, partial [Legionella sp.]|nr:hypothetical protein [Legionella sp.]
QPNVLGQFHKLQVIASALQKQKWWCDLVDCCNYLKHIGQPNLIINENGLCLFNFEFNDERISLLMLISEALNCSETVFRQIDNISFP